jgi:hypothetical protein
MVKGALFISNKVFTAIKLESEQRNCISITDSHTLKYQIPKDQINKV